MSLKEVSMWQLTTDEVLSIIPERTQATYLNDLRRNKVDKAKRDLSNDLQELYRERTPTGLQYWIIDDDVTGSQNLPAVISSLLPSSVRPWRPVSQREAVRYGQRLDPRESVEENTIIQCWTIKDMAYMLESGYRRLMRDIVALGDLSDADARVRLSDINKEADNLDLDIRAFDLMMETQFPDSELRDVNTPTSGGRVSPVRAARVRQLTLRLLDIKKQRDDLQAMLSSR